MIDESFPHDWRAEILAARPLILPPRHFTYPREAEEVERGALEVLVRVEGQGLKPGSFLDAGCGTTEVVPLYRGSDATIEATQVSKTGRPGAPGDLGLEFGVPESTDDGAPGPSSCAQPFLATCALGFRDGAVPTGVWSCPNPAELCAVSGGYAYLIDTTEPERFTMLPYRPVLEVRPAPAQGLLLFVSHHRVLAWGRDGQAWESPKLSDEGLTLGAMDGDTLHGMGWNMMTDQETPFALDLRSGTLTQPQ